MTIADTITSMKENIQDAYDAIEALGGDLPDNLNLENMADAIQSTAKATPIGPWGRLIYINQTKAIGISLQTQEEFNALATNGNLNSTITIQGNTFAKSRVAAFSFGNNFPTTIPDYFLYNFTGLGVGGLSTNIPSGVTTIGDHFMDGCITYNYAMSLPASISVIGTYFRARNAGASLTNISATQITAIPDYFHYSNYRLTSNTAVVIPDGVISIGNYFLADCKSFNATVTLPSTVKTIGNRFLENCLAFNSALTVNGQITSIGDRFMANCINFNQTLTIEGDNGAIGELFLYRAQLNASEISVNLNGSWSSIGSGFIRDSATLNVPINIAGNNLSIGSAFLYGSSLLNKTVRFTGTVKSIGNYFMAYCPALHQIILGNPFSSTYAALATVESIGLYFMAFSYTLDVYTPPALRSLGSGFLYSATVSNIYNNSPLLVNIPNSFCQYCKFEQIGSNVFIGTWVETIGSNFCSGADFSSLGRVVYNSSAGTFSNNSIPAFPSLTSVGTNFLANCKSWFLLPTWALSLTNLQQIPAGFMQNCTAFISRVDFGSDVTLADSYTTATQPFSTSLQGAPSYTVGVTIGGAGASKVLQGLPNSSSGYYRNLKAI